MKTFEKQIANARKKVNELNFGTAEWEQAMQVVRDLVAAESASNPQEAFCSVDSGWHPTRLSNGKTISA